jgi:hydrogenase maturation protease
LAETLADQLMALERPVVVVCVGNVLHGDDGFGPAVGSKLAHYNRLIEAGSAPERELPRVAKMQPRTVLLVDAVAFGGEHGDLRLIPAHEWRSDVVEGHMIPLDTCAAYVRETCNGRTFLLAAQPGPEQLGTEMSPEMRQAVTRAAGLLKTVLED